MRCSQSYSERIANQIKFRAEQQKDLFGSPPNAPPSSTPSDRLAQKKALDQQQYEEALAEGRRQALAHRLAVKAIAAPTRGVAFVVDLSGAADRSPTAVAVPTPASVPIPESVPVVLTGAAVASGRNQDIDSERSALVAAVAADVFAPWQKFMVLDGAPSEDGVDDHIDVDGLAAAVTAVEAQDSGNVVDGFTDADCGDISSSGGGVDANVTAAVGAVGAQGLKVADAFGQSEESVESWLDDSEDAPVDDMLMASLGSRSHWKERGDLTLTSQDDVRANEKRGSGLTVV